MPSPRRERPSPPASPLTPRSATCGGGIRGEHWRRSTKTLASPRSAGPKPRCSTLSSAAFPPCSTSAPSFGSDGCEASTSICFRFLLRSFSPSQCIVPILEEQGGDSNSRASACRYAAASVDVLFPCLLLRAAQRSYAVAQMPREAIEPCPPRMAGKAKRRIGRHFGVSAR